MNAGTDHDTAAFAVESIRRWWSARGSADHPGARRLLITADAGGSNGYRTRAWKAGLAALAAETGPGDHLLPFPARHLQVEQDRAPAVLPHHHELAGPAVDQPRSRRQQHRRHHHPHRADACTPNWTPALYATGSKVSDAQLAALPLTRHGWHGDWNYTLRPQPYHTPASAPPPPARPRPDLAWLSHPAITGLPPAALDALTAALTSPAGQLREAALTAAAATAPASSPPAPPPPPHHPHPQAPRRHLAPPPQPAPASHRRPVRIRHELISRHISDIRLFLHQTGHTIQPSTTKLATLDDLYRYATAHGIPTPAEINTAC